MEIEKILLLLKNSGLTVKGVDSGFIYFEEPFCIYSAFDTILHYSWIVILTLTGIMLFGWAFLYIKNGTNITDVFKNAKTLILIFCILSVIKPIVNFVYGDRLLSRNCEIKKVSLDTVQELVATRQKTLSKSDEDALYEIFDVVDSGVIVDDSVTSASVYE